MRTALDKEEGKAKIAKVTQLQVIAKELNCTVSQLCLAWCLSNQNVSSVILGASKISQLEENLGAIDVYKLMDDKVLAKIEAVLKNKPEIEKDRH
jgi:aryl-alcohol dehydrogenase-like predicted oxidoreductase